MNGRWLMALLAAGLVLLAAGGCGSNDLATRWDGGALAVAGGARPQTMTLQQDGSAPVQMAPRGRARLAQSVAFSDREQVAWRSEFAAPGWLATLLSLELQPGVEVPLAAVLRTEDRKRTLAVLWCAASGTAALERLHTFLLGVPAETRVELKDGCKVLAADAPAQPPSQVAELLRRVAQARTAHAAAVPAAGPQWRLVDITPSLDGNLPLQMAAVVQHAGVPVGGVRVSFAREPHLACVAQTAADGAARCTLYDTHGHAPHEAGPTLPPTIVTFAGRLEGHDLDVPSVVVAATPQPTRCLSSAVPADVAAGWGADCRGFAARTWTLPVATMR